VREACDCIPDPWVAQGRRAQREIGDASHVLTVWFTDPAYVDPFGKPRPLAFAGPRNSVTALVRSVDSQLNAQEVLKYLAASGAVRRVGRRFIPRARTLLLRGAQGPDYFRTLRVLANMLRTLEHNVLPKRAVKGWYEYFAENPRFPTRARAQLDALVERQGEELLKRADALMRHCEVNRKPGERTVRVCVGLHLWEDDRRLEPLDRRRGRRDTARPPARSARRR